MKEMKDVLKDLREEKNLSQMQLATKLNLSVSAIGMYESGKRIPRPEILETFADFYNVDMDYLFGRTMVRNKMRDFKGLSTKQGTAINLICNSIQNMSDEEIDKMLDMLNVLFDGRFKKEDKKSTGTPASTKKQ